MAGLTPEDVQWYQKRGISIGSGAPSADSDVDDPRLTPSLADTPEKKVVEYDIRKSALKQGVDPDLAAGVGFQESGFNRDAISQTGVKGPMQLTQRTGRSLGYDRDIYDQNIDGGVALLKQGLDAHPDDLDQALSVYPDPKDASFWVNAVKSHADRAKKNREGGNSVASDNAQTGLTDEDKAWYKKRGLSYPGMEDEPPPPNAIDKVKSLYKQGSDLASEGIDKATPVAKKVFSDVLMPPIDLARNTVASVGSGLIDFNKQIPFGPIGYGLDKSGLADKAQTYLKSIQQQAQESTPELNQSLVDLIPENARAVAHETAKILPIYQLAKKIMGDKFADSGLDETEKVGKGLLTPANAGYIPLVAAGPVPAALTGLSMMPGMSEGIEEGGKDTWSGIQTRDPEKMARGAVKALTSAAMTYGLGHGLVDSGMKVPERVYDNFIPPEKPVQEAIDGEIVPQAEPLQLTDGKNVRAKEYIPIDKPQAYVSDVESLKNQPFSGGKVPVEETVTSQTERPYRPLKTVKEKLFPFLPDEFATEKKVSTMYDTLPDQVLPREPTGFETKIQKTIDKTQPYPQEYHAEQTKPETAETLKAQMDSLKKNRSKAVLITPGEVAPVMSKRFKALKTDVGTFIYDPMRVSKQSISDKVANGTHGELLGHLEPKSAATTQTVAALDAKGNELKTSVVSPENVEAQAKILKGQFPKAKIEVGGEDLAKDILNKREPVKKIPILRQEAAFVGVKPVKEVPPVNEPLQGVKDKQSGLAKGVEAKAIERGLTEGFDGVSGYESINIKEQAQRASDLISKDYNRAKRIAMGREDAPPGVKSFSVYNALETKALLDGDVDTLRDLATKSSLNEESSGAAQTLRLLRERSPESPISAIQDVVKSREEAVKRRVGRNIEKAKKAVSKEIEAKLKELAPDKNSWSEFIKSIRC